MRNRLFAVLVIALLSLSLLTGCIAGYAKAPNLPLLQKEYPIASNLLEESQVRTIIADHARLEEDALTWLRMELDVDFGILRNGNKIL